MVVHKLCLISECLLHHAFDIDPCSRVIQKPSLSFFSYTIHPNPLSWLSPTFRSWTWCKRLDITVRLPAILVMHAQSPTISSFSIHKHDLFIILVFISNSLLHTSLKTGVYPISLRTSRRGSMLSSFDPRSYPRSQRTAQMA